MNIRLSTRALIDLEALHDYLPEKSPSGYRNVSAAIEATIRDIPGNLFRGRETPIDEVWERLVPKYGYVIPYCIRGDTCYILRVYHSSRVGLDYSGELNVEMGLSDKPKIPNEELEAAMREARSPEFKKTARRYSSVDEFMEDLDS